MGNEWIGVLFGYAIGALIGFGVLWFVIYSSVLSALRAHTMSSTGAVSVTSSVPLKVKLPREQIAQIRGEEPAPAADVESRSA